MSNPEKNNDDIDREFELFDLEIMVESIEGNCTCEMSIGSRFWVKGGSISFPSEQPFCLYALQSCLPLIPAKQRKNSSKDWMETDSLVSCPDPACKLIMRINRMGIQKFDHNKVSANKI